MVAPEAAIPGASVEAIEVQPQPTATKENNVALSFTSILSDIGTGLKKFFSAALPVAEAAEPIIAVAFPGVSALYDATVTEIGNAETAAIAAGAQSGTGAQKLAAVVAAVTPTFTAYATAQGLPAPTTATITNWVNAAVASLNAIPAATAPTA
jgi:uncharacterized membrane protein (Fun14 family)